MTMFLARTLRSVLVLPLLFATSCSYLKNRANDALDIFYADVGLGPGLMVEARVTDFAATGLGYRDQELAMLCGRFAGCAEVEGGGLVLLTGERLGDWDGLAPLLPGDTSKFDRQLAPAGGQAVFVIPLEVASRPGLFQRSDHVLHCADLNAGVTLGYVGARVGLSPGEFLDFLLGWFGLDLGGDDAFGRPEPKPNPKVQAATPLAWR